MKRTDLLKMHENVRLWAPDRKQADKISRMFSNIIDRMIDESEDGPITIEEPEE